MDNNIFSGKLSKSGGRPWPLSGSSITTDQQLANPEAPVAKHPWKTFVFSTVEQQTTRFIHHVIAHENRQQHLQIDSSSSSIADPAASVQSIKSHGRKSIPIGGATTKSIQAADGWAAIMTLSNLAAILQVNHHVCIKSVPSISIIVGHGRSRTEIGPHKFEQWAVASPFPQI
ncbi:hypothetical protein ACLOJK_026895, partial [Asimina triloba]